MTTGGSLATTTNVWPDNVAPSVTTQDDTGDAALLFGDYIRNGPNPERLAYEARVTFGAMNIRRTGGASVWEFVADAVEGSGGFANGAYLFPFKLELDESGITTDKYRRRQGMADYDNFAQHVCNTPWDVIVGSSDLVERHGKAGTPESDMLNEFWENCDGRGTSIQDFLEFPHRQARMHGTGIIIIDRPEVQIVSEADNQKPENRPYIYAVPTRNVVHWEFGEDGELAGIIVLEPQLDAETRKEFTNIRVWTRSEWAVYKRLGEAGAASSVSELDYELIGSGKHTLGEVPVVAIYNDSPAPRHLLSHTEMLDVARLAQTVYNIDSETREIERKCAVFLAIPVKATDTYTEKKMILSTDNALLYDGDAGHPMWVSPDLKILDMLGARRQEKKRDAYQMAGLGALAISTGTIRTSSGYHADVEFAKTERRIARHASMLEAVEKRLARLYLKFYGIDADTQDDLFSVTYPNDYGVRDMAALIDRTGVILDMGLGDLWDTATLSKMAKAQFPRLSQDESDAMVAGAIKARSLAQQQQTQMQRVQAIANAIKSPPLTLPSRTKADRQAAAGGGETSPDA
jgi:hypothetical protein